MVSNNFSSESDKYKLQPYWITGFLDAESTFSIRIGKDIRDIEVLHKIRWFFNAGSVIVRIRDGKSTGIY